MKYIILYIIVLAGCFTACQQEDSLTPSNISDLFAPNPEATDAESVLRREFFIVFKLEGQFKHDR